MDKNLLYAYMAGFVDGDGYISIVSVSKAKNCISKIAVTNCNYEIIEKFSNEFGR